MVGLNMIICPQCNVENPDMSFYCSNCGNQLKMTLNSEKEVLQEMVYVRWNMNKGNRIGTRLYQKILYFTDSNIYIGEGKLIAGLGANIFGFIGNALEEKALSGKNSEAMYLDFKELAAGDPEVLIIPYNDIISLNLEKKTFFKPDPKIKMTTTEADYEFIISQKKRYKQYSQSLPLILGDKVRVE